MQIRRNQPAPITFSVGKPPPTPRQHRPVSIWPTVMLGTLVLITAMTIWLGHQAPADSGQPAGTTASSSQTTAP